MMIKFGSSSSSRTPLQPRLRHSPTAGTNLWNKSGLTLQSRCALSDQQVTCHHLRRNLFKLNQQGTASPNDATCYLHSYQKSVTSLIVMIAIMDEFDRQINFNSLEKSATSLPAVIAIIDESNHQINFNSLNKFVTPLSAAIGALDSLLEPHPESNLVTVLYSDSTLIANMDMSSC
jgi:hypothetical protein